MIRKTLLCAAFAGLSFGSLASADTVYDMTFTDDSTNQLISSATGSFTINASDQVTLFQVTFTVLKPFTEGDGINYSPGDQLVFNTSSSQTTLGSGPLPTYDPTTNSFMPGDRDYKILMYEQPSSDPNKGGRLAFDSNNGLGTGYGVWGLALGEFFTNGDSGTWSITPAKTAATPEPGSFGFLALAGFGAAAFLRNRRR